ncbi:MAG: hypothetical protein RL377_956, partial [Bacteroidota bacterium]
MNRLTFKTPLIFIVAFLFFTPMAIFAQVPSTGIFFQAIARDKMSNPAKDRKIYIQSSILQASPTGTAVLTETHEANTDATGVFGISIGQGTRIAGTATGLSSIPWAQGPFYLSLKIAITPAAPSPNWDYTKDLIDLGSTPFGTVPYALYAGSAGSLNDKLSISDTAAMLAYYAKSQQVNTLAASLNSKISFGDTAAMLAPYANAVRNLISTSNITNLTANNVNNALNNKVNLADSNSVYITPTQLATKTFDTSSLNRRINDKLSIS